MTRPERALAGGFVIFLLLRVMGCAGHAAAQSDDGLVRDVLQLSFHESVDPLADAPGIFSVIVNGASERGVSTRSFARSYAPRFFRHETARPWFSRLALTCGRPDGFRGNWSQPRLRGPSLHDVCVAVVELVRSFDAPTCPATFWGSTADYRSGPHAAAHASDVFVECGDHARNLFSRRGPR